MGLDCLIREIRMQNIDSINNLSTNTNITKAAILNMDRNIIEANIIVSNLDMQIILIMIFTICCLVVNFLDIFCYYLIFLFNYIFRVTKNILLSVLELSIIN